MSRIYNPKPTSGKMTSSSSGAFLTRGSSVAMTTTTSGATSAMRRQASASASSSSPVVTGADPLRLVKVDTSPLSTKAQQTLSLLEQQNERKKELVNNDVTDSSNWETSLSRWKNRRRSEPNYQFKSFDVLVDKIDVDQDDTISSNNVSTKSSQGSRLTHQDDNIRQLKSTEYKTGNTTLEPLQPSNGQRALSVDKTTPSPIFSLVTCQPGQSTSLVEDQDAVDSRYVPDIVSSSSLSGLIISKTAESGSQKSEEQYPDVLSGQRGTNVDSVDSQRKTPTFPIPDTSTLTGSFSGGHTGGETVTSRDVYGAREDSNDEEHHQLEPDVVQPVTSLLDAENGEQSETTSSEDDVEMDEAESPPPLPSVPPPSLRWTMFPSASIEEEQDFEFDVQVPGNRAAMTSHDSNDKTNALKSHPPRFVIDRSNATQPVSATQRNATQPASPMSPTSTLILSPKPYKAPRQNSVVEAPAFVPTSRLTNHVANTSSPSLPSLSSWPSLPTLPSSTSSLQSFSTETGRSSAGPQSPPLASNSAAAQRRPSGYRLAFSTAVKSDANDLPTSNDNKSTESAAAAAETETTTSTLSRTDDKVGCSVSEVSGDRRGTAVTRPNGGQRTPSSYSGFNSRASFAATSELELLRPVDMRRRMTVDASTADLPKREYFAITNRKYGFINAAPKPKYADGNSWIGRSISQDKF